MRKVGKSITLSWKINKREKKKLKKKRRRKENIGNGWIMWWLNRSIITKNATL